MQHNIIYAAEKTSTCLTVNTGGKGLWHSESIQIYPNLIVLNNDNNRTQQKKNEERRASSGSYFQRATSNKLVILNIDNNSKQNQI